MRYLCLIYHDEANIAAIPAARMETIMAEVMEDAEQLRRGGHYLAASPLEPVAAAATVSLRTGRLVVTDGPFAETKEQVGGFYLLEARDLNEAMRLAARLPSARLGTIEIRPLREGPWTHLAE